jgi:hypothetical protein
LLALHFLELLKLLGRTLVHSARLLLTVRRFHGLLDVGRVFGIEERLGHSQYRVVEHPTHGARRTGRSVFGRNKTHARHDFSYGGYLLAKSAWLLLRLLRGWGRIVR